MSIKVYKHEILPLFLLYGLCFISALIETDFTSIVGGIISSIIYGVCILLISKRQGRLMGVASIFISLIYVLHCGELVVSIFNYTSYGSYIIPVQNSVSNEVFFRSYLFSIFSMCFFTTGYLFTNTESNKDIKPIESENEDYYVLKKNIFTGGIILFAVCLIPHAYIDITQWAAYRTSGVYAEIYHIQIPGLFSILNPFFYPSIFMIIIGCQSSKRAKLISMLFAVYLIFSMGKGSRIQQLILLVSLFLLYIYYISPRKIRLKQIIALLFVAYILVLVINLVGRLRGHGGILDLGIVIDTLRTSSPLDVILDQLMELGGTQVSLAYAVETVPERIFYLFGLNYLAGLLSVYPNIGGLLGKATKYYGFTSSFPDYIRAHNLGGSILGEAYTNFGFIGGCVVLFVIGIVVAKVDKEFRKCCECNDVYSLMLLMFLIPNLFLWTRDYFYCMVYTFFWMSLYLRFILRTNSVKKGKI
ncbi:O-antigen polysaccharide polymerase Wzy [Coprococcus catus]